MNIETYFKKSKGSWPKKNVAGVESEWMKLGTIEIPTGSLWAGDPWVANAEDGVVVRVPKGRYMMEAKGMDFKGHRRVSRIRVYREGVKSPTTSKSGKETWTDVGMIGVCDIRALQRAVSEKFVDEYMNDIQEVTDGAIANCVPMEYGGKSFQMAAISSGLGDGSFPVYPLKYRGKTIGMEIEFLACGFKLTDDFRIIG